jgi:hypothetical protein
MGDRTSAAKERAKEASAKQTSAKKPLDESARPDWVRVDYGTWASLH